MVNISVELAPTQVKFLQDLINSQQYCNRSEIIRDLLRRAEFDWMWKKEMQEIAQKGISLDIEAERTKVSKKLLKRFERVL